MGAIKTAADAAIVDGTPVDKGDLRNVTDIIDSSVLALEAEIDVEIANRGNAIDVVQDNIDSHVAASSNPHSVTKAQVGLGNADNTSDANKPVSIAQQAAIDVVQDNLDSHAVAAGPHSGVLAPLASPTFTGTPAAPTAAGGTNTTQVATTAFVTAAVAPKAPTASPTFTGTPAAPTAAPGANTTQVATTAFVTAADAVLDATKAPLASPTFTGTPAVPTAAAGTNTTQAASTAFVTTAIDAKRTYSDAERKRPELAAAFASTLTGGNRTAITNGSAQVHSALGAVRRLTGDDEVAGSQDIAPIQETAIEASRVYRARVSFQRSVDPADPEGHGIELRMQNLTLNRASVSDVLIHSFGGVVIADGIQDYSFTFSRAAGQDYQNPATTRYAVPFLRIYGGDHETDIAVIEVEDVTEEVEGDASLAADIATEAAARAAAVSGEATTRAAADAAEAAARAAADTAEATTRGTADTALQTNIDTEEAARIAGDIDSNKPETLFVAGKTKPMRSTLRIPVTSGQLFNTSEITTDEAGLLLAQRDSAGAPKDDVYPFGSGRRYPKSPFAFFRQPAFGAVIDGQLLGITADRQLEARIERAYSVLGRAPRMPVAPDVARIITGVDGEATVGEAYGGAPISYIARPTVTTEWMLSNGTVVAPFTVSSRECIVAYVPGTGRVVLTPFSDYHFITPQLAYGDKCVIAWRYADGDARSTARAFAIAIDGTGDMVPEDPNGLFVFLANGQSLSVGSHGNDEYPWLNNSWPDHTLVLQNTTIPGDVRLGRDADDVDFELDPGTIGGFTAMLPQGGNPANLGFSPIEGLVFALQEKIVRKFGRPQRMCAAALGVSGASIDQLSTGTDTRANLEAAIDEIVASAEAEGWTPYFEAYLWIQGESDVTDVAATYQTAFETEVDEVRALCLAAAGTEPKAVVWSWSSFAEAADNETTILGGVLGQVQAYIADPDTIKLVGPHYPLQAYYNPDNSGTPDWVHFLAGGYLRLGETAAYTVLREIWGLGGAEPLHVLSAVYDDNGGAGPVTVTITWSRGIQQDVTLVPVRDGDGLEVAYASATFKAIISHAITPGSATSVLTLESALTAPQLAAATLQVGLKGQTTPRDADNVPGTNIRASAGAYDRSEYDGKPYYHFAVHQRIALS
jgi:hypothetical protein